MNRYGSARRIGLAALKSAILLGTASAGLAQQTLPAPSAPFQGVVGETYADSRPAFPARPTAPAGAPNVLIFITDDVGFGAASTFGGPIPTPNLDRLAARGLVYNRFHTTAMCSPTRAALLTGRNHHAVANGTVANLSTGFPGYTNIMPKSAASIAEVLRQNGYNTAMFGKHHNAPESDVSPNGPFDMWPTGLGFEYFYGFMGAQTNQFSPALYRNTAPIPTLDKGLLDSALADEAIRWVHNQKAARPDKPFFVYYATGSTHAPIQAPAEWLAKFRGQFDNGWDAVREQTYERQRRMGIIPADAVNTPRPEGIKAWTALTPDQRRINARMMEAYGAMLAYQDAEIGRVLDELERMGQADNTLIMFVEGDNGASAEAGHNGGLNPMAAFANGMRSDDATLLANLDKIGGPEASPNLGFGWAWAMDAPFQLFKQFASHLGGTRNGLVISWPERIKSTGIRSQFTHVTDIMPTVLEAAGIRAPASVNGVKQQPIDGVSLAYSFDKPQAREQHKTQYFEMLGSRAIYHDGWLASTVPPNLPWARGQKSVLPNEYGWELYNLNVDFSQSKDLSKAEPARLKAMQALFRKEAQRNNVFPLDDRLNLARFQASESQIPARSNYVYWGGEVSVPAASAAPLLNRAFRITADIDLPQSGGVGPLVALGSAFGGWSFYLKDGRAVALMAASQLDGDQFRVSSDAPLPAGRGKLVFDYHYAGGANGGGEMVISLNDREIGRGRIARGISKLPEITDTLDIGMDASTPVTADYPHGSRFPGTIRSVRISVGRQGAAGSAP